MSDDLFGSEATQSLSPKMRWLAQHGLETEQMANAGQEGDDGDPIPNWICRVKAPKSGSALYRDSEIAGGADEQEAIANLALKRGLRLWFECEAP